MVRDSSGCVHLGKSKTVKRLFVRAGAGAERYTKSKPLSLFIILVQPCTEAPGSSSTEGATTEHLGLS